MKRIAVDLAKSVYQVAESVRSGQVVQRKAQPFESVASGAALLEIVDNRSLEIRLLVPSRWV